MANGVTRLGDYSSVHDKCFAGRPCNESSDNVFVNDIGVHRVGDGWEDHYCAFVQCSGAVTESGSSTVFVNDQAIARIDDKISDGSTIVDGSSDVFAG